MLHFLISVIFYYFLNYMPNKVKNSKFGKQLNFALSGTELKKSAKIEKMQHLIRCFKSKKQFKINLKNCCQLLAHFEQEVVKNVFFCDFLKKCEFWSKLDITNVFLVKFPF